MKPSKKNIIVYSLNYKHFFSYLLGNVEYEGDYHWYRLDSGELWSHKPGIGHATRLDNAGHNITDPRHAAMGEYRFVSFMTCDRNFVNLEDPDFECDVDVNLLDKHV